MKNSGKLELKRVLLFVSLMIGMSMPLLAQAARGGKPDIRSRLEQIERGQSDAVRAELPTLMTNFQNHPGVLYLQGVLTTDGTEAARIYQSIVDNFPKSEWADDALYKLYQYYYSIGLYKTADQKLQQLKTDYPYSTYAMDQQLEEEPKTASLQTEAPAVINQPSPGKIEKFSTLFTIQVGTFSILQNAEELKTKFEKEGYPSNIFTVVQNGRKLHKVWVGEFQSHEEAKRFTTEIKKKFSLDCIVVSR